MRGKPSKVASIKISNTMRPDLMSSSQTLGCWDPFTSSIVIWRPQLNSFEEFSGVLIHELVHAKTGYFDVTRDFETALTLTIGDLCAGWRSAVTGASPKQGGPSVQPEGALRTQASPPAASGDGPGIGLDQLQAELIGAHETIARLRTDVLAAEARAGSAVPQASHLAVAAAAGQLPTSSSSGQAFQLEEARETIARLQQEVASKREKTARAVHERQVSQADLDKFRTMQQTSAVRSPTRSAGRPWYKFW